MPDTAMRPPQATNLVTRDDHQPKLPRTDNEGVAVDNEGQRNSLTKVAAQGFSYE